jgi:hypothetical protein
VRKIVEVSPEAAGFPSGRYRLWVSQISRTFHFFTLFFLTFVTFRKIKMKVVAFVELRTRQNQWLFFKNCSWRIRAAKIELRRAGLLGFLGFLKEKNVKKQNPLLYHTGTARRRDPHSTPPSHPLFSVMPRHDDVRRSVEHAVETAIQKYDSDQLLRDDEYYTIRKEIADDVINNALGAEQDGRAAEEAAEALMKEMKEGGGGGGDLAFITTMVAQRVQASLDEPANI